MWPARGTSDTPTNQVSPECGKSGGEVGNAGRVRARHEPLNRWLKNWGILSQVYQHNIMRHGDVFRACAVVTQLTIKNGEPLFEVEYKD